MLVIGEREREGERGGQPSPGRKGVATAFLRREVDSSPSRGRGGLPLLLRREV